MSWPQGIGFTGSRHGMTDAQKAIVIKLLLDWEELELAHNGGCVGADEQFEEICDKLLISSVRWPADNVSLKWVSTRKPAPNTKIQKERPTQVRNELIVLNSVKLIATPQKPFSYNTRSGTWSTIHHAIDKGKRVYIVQADGLIDLR